MSKFGHNLKFQGTAIIHARENIENGSSERASLIAVTKGLGDYYA